MKLLFFLAVWKRPEITEICFMGLHRLKRLKKYPMEFFAVISEESMKPLCKKYGVKYCFHENEPLGKKKNFGLQQAMKRDFDYLIEIGSDDLLKNEFLDLYDFSRDVMALREVLMLNTKTGNCLKISSNRIKVGAGRAISKRALGEMLEGGLWRDDLNKGLDNNSIMALAKKGFFEKRVSGDEPVLIDLKSDVNIWSYDRFREMGKNYPISKALKGLSDEEINAIACLRASVNSTAA